MRAMLSCILGTWMAREPRSYLDPKSKQHNAVWAFCGELLCQHVCILLVSRQRPPGFLLDIGFLGRFLASLRGFWFCIFCIPLENTWVCRGLDKCTAGASKQVGESSPPYHTPFDLSGKRAELGFVPSLFAGEEPMKQAVAAQGSESKFTSSCTVVSSLLLLAFVHLRPAC